MMASPPMEALRPPLQMVTVPMPMVQRPAPPRQVISLVERREQIRAPAPSQPRPLPRSPSPKAMLSPYTVAVAHLLDSAKHVETEQDKAEAYIRALRATQTKAITELNGERGYDFLDPFCTAGETGRSTPPKRLVQNSPPAPPPPERHTVAIQASPQVNPRRISKETTLARAAFEAQDADGDGRLSMSEFYLALRRLGIEVSDEEIDRAASRRPLAIPDDSDSESSEASETEEVVVTERVTQGGGRRGSTALSDLLGKLHAANKALEEEVQTTAVGGSSASRDLRSRRSSITGLTFSSTAKSEKHLQRTQSVGVHHGRGMQQSPVLSDTGSVATRGDLGSQWSVLLQEADEHMAGSV